MNFVTISPLLGTSSQCIRCYSTNKTGGGGGVGGFGPLNEWGADADAVRRAEDNLGLYQDQPKVEGYIK